MGLFGSNKVLGIDVGTSYIKIVQVKKEKKLYKANGTIIPTPPESVHKNGMIELDEIGGLIAEAIKAIGLKVGGGISLVSSDCCIVRILGMPPLNKADMQEAIYWEAEKHIPIPLSEAMMDWGVINEKEDGVEILLVAVNKEIAHNQALLLEQCGVKPLAVEAEGMALLRTLQVIHPIEDNVALIDMGGGSTNVVITRNDIPYLTRSIPLGGRHFTRTIQEILAITWQEAEAMKIEQGMAINHPDMDVIWEDLLRKISRSFEYFRLQYRDQKIQHCFLTGGGALLKGFATALQDLLGLPVSILNPLDVIVPSKGLLTHQEILDKSPAMMAAALGCALRQVKY